MVDGKSAWRQLKHQRDDVGARGHKNDWDHFAAESGDDGWSYSNVVDIYRRIEDWQGAPDAKRRGTGGLVVVEQSPASPIVRALCEGAPSLGIPHFADQNGAMMETEGRRGARQFSDTRWPTAVGFSQLRLSLHGSTESDGAHECAGDTRQTERRESDRGRGDP